MSDPIDTLTKLFDTLKDASFRNEQSTQRLIDQQLELVSHIKDMPIEEVKRALQSHASETKSGFNERIATTATLLAEIKKIGAKVTKMIIVVSVTLTVATAGYFLIKYAAEHDKHPPVDWQSKYEQIEKEQQDMIDSKLEKLMKDVRNEIKRLHPIKENGAKTDESVHK